MDRRSFLGILGGVFTGACLPKIVGPRRVQVAALDDLQRLALLNFDRAWVQLLPHCRPVVISPDGRWGMGDYVESSFHVPQRPNEPDELLSKLLMAPGKCAEPCGLRIVG
jgi:hypothetical protein